MRYKYNRSEYAIEYKAWSGMKNKCYNPNSLTYKNYGALGIRVCDEWVDSFDAFMDHVGKKPGEEFYLDRINNDEDYKPGNVKWTSLKEHAKNKRDRNSHRSIKNPIHYRITTFRSTLTFCRHIYGYLSRIRSINSNSRMKSERILSGILGWD